MKSPRYPQLVVLLAVSLAAALLLAACASTGSKPHASRSPVDTGDPQAVLRADFAAWAAGDWAREASFMSSNYANMAAEPVSSLRILQIEPLHVTRTKAVYNVRFQITVKGEGVSMTSGTYAWTYELTWHPKRNSWIITNYGED